MTTTTIESRDGTLYGHAARRVNLTCPHGSSTFFVLPGRDPKANLAAVELLWVRHATRHRCDCGSAKPGRLRVVVQAINADGPPSLPDASGVPMLPGCRARSQRLRAVRSLRRAVATMGERVGLLTTAMATDGFQPAASVTLLLDAVLIEP